MILLKTMYIMLRYWKYIPNITKFKNKIPSITNLTNNAFLNAKIIEVKYSYLEYGIGFHSRSLFPISNFDCDKNVIIFGVDMSSSACIDNKKTYRYHNSC